MESEPEYPLRRHGMTEEEFYAYADEDCPWQFLGGELVREPEHHEELFAFLLTLLRLYLEERGGAEVRGSRYAMRLDPKWSPEPDVMVVRAENVHRIGPQRIEGPADLVIEVASPGDVRRALRLKLPRYLEARIPEIWVVDPYAQSVRVETFEGQAHHSRVVTAGRLDSAVFPGFWIDVSWLWRQPLPPTLACARQILG